MRLVLCLSILALSGCATLKPQKGGRADIWPVDQRGIESELPLASMQQPENPNSASTQESAYERTVETVYPVETVFTSVSKAPDGTETTKTEVLPAGTVKREILKHNVKQNVSPSWKDTAREIQAKLGSFKAVQWMGGLMLVAAVSCFHPVVRTIIGGGKQIPMILAATGAALIFGPAIIVGNEKLFLIGGIIIPSIAYLLIRLSHKEGKEDAAK